ncbi:MAG: hypothetical protein D6714_01130 [Bacteroidetes bacterium]|nr:MAG: hypothetical protein D6714_01130 [Bacteroidota bacterium]
MPRTLGPPIPVTHLKQRTMTNGFLPALWLFLFTLLVVPVSGQTAPHFEDIHHDHGQSLLFIQNQNQWRPEVAFKTSFAGTVSLFLEKNAFTYVLTHPEDIRRVHDWPLVRPMERKDFPVRHHAYRVRFEGAQEPTLSGQDSAPFYYNYFLGDEPGKWASRVPLFEKVTYQNLYKGIDLEAYSSEGYFKYDFVVAPGADAGDIRLVLEGIDDVSLEYGALRLNTSIHPMIEQRPVAWQVIQGEKRPVACRYRLENKTVQFEFPDGYDPAYPLIIDPTVVGATLSGTNGEENFGHSATYDNLGNIYTAGRSFGPGYPTTLGAFQQIYGGGDTDIAISKYNPNGSDLIYATYIGGSKVDLPHSIVTDFNQQLYVYGTSESSNYPTTPNAIQKNKGGNTDIVVTILNADGTALVGSSFMGGSKDDGLNNSTLNANYGDTFRGEILLDAQNNIYVVSSTNSSNFPVTPNAYDQTYNSNGSIFFYPAQDVVVFKANSDMSQLYFSTYLGGDQSDIGNGIRVDDMGRIYITGTAGADNFPTRLDAVSPNWPGGEENAFVAVFSPDGSTLLTSTFWGSMNNEHAYFIDLDEEGNVHIYGQSTGGVMPVTPGVYNNPHSRQFISAFTPDLKEVVYSTVIGTGSSFSPDFVPVAFMVDKCDGIYFSGYEAKGNLPMTSDAIVNAPGTFYIGVLEPFATGLVFGSYYGDADHVDGGTSRFDKGGVIYQGVCSCDFTGILNTTPDAWATSQLTTCDVGVFKIDFDIETVTAQGAALPSTSGCAPFEVNFVYTGQDAQAWFWDFGDGETSTLENPVHTFTEGGTFEVMLIATNPDACNPQDTFYLRIDVLDGSSQTIQKSLCDGTDLQLNVTTQNATYLWNDGATTPTYTVSTPGVYWVEIMAAGCMRVDTFVVSSASDFSLDLGDEVVGCGVPSVTLDGKTPGVVSYLWSDGSTNPNLIVTTSGEYWLEATDAGGCQIRDTVEVLLKPFPQPDLPPDTTLCDAETLHLTTSETNVTYLWSDGSTAPALTVSAPGLVWVELDNGGCTARDSINIEYFAPLTLDAKITDVLCADNCDGQLSVAAMGGAGAPYQFDWNTGQNKPFLDNLCPDMYEVTVTDLAECTASAQLPVMAPPPLEMTLATGDINCPGEQSGFIEITNVTGGVPDYVFSIGGGVFGLETGAAGLSGGDYDVEVMDANGCFITQTVHLNEPDGFVVNAGEDAEILLGETIELRPVISPLTNQDIAWSSTELLDCPNCLRPQLTPVQSALYTLTVTDPESGCFQTDSVWVFVRPVRDVFIPNAFSPNGDGNNDSFTIFAGGAVSEIVDFEIFDRWGELVFARQNFDPNDPSLGWDGTFKGQPLHPGVFTWFAKIRYLDGVQEMRKGSVTLAK